MDNPVFLPAAAAALAGGILLYTFLRRANAGAVPPAEGSAFRKFGLNIRLRDLFRLAALIEEAGKDFYAKLERKAVNPETKKLCAWLAEEEEKHRRFVQGHLDRWRGLPPHLTECPAFLEKVRQEGFYADPPGENATEEELAAFAIRQERKTAEFYQLFESAFPEEWRRSRLERLVGEERAHEAKLRAAYPGVK